MNEHVSEVLRGNLPGDPVARIVPVYLPPGYDDDPDRRYPTIYMLAGHGSSGPMLASPRPWEESFPERLDRLITSGQMDAVIGVLPDCWTVFGGSQYIDSGALGSYDRYLNDEIIGFVDASYRTLARPENRAIVGKSSGGFGAMVQSWLHPENWGAVASHSGDIYFEYGYLPDVAKFHRNLRQFGGLDAFIGRIPVIRPRVHDPFFSTLGILCYAAAYGPVPDRPHGFAMPVDMETGALDHEVWSRWLAWDPVRLIEDLSHQETWRRLSYLYLDCGEFDELNFQVGTRVLERRLRELDIRADVRFFDAGHLEVNFRLDCSLPELGRAISTQGRRAAANLRT